MGDDLLPPSTTIRLDRPKTFQLESPRTFGLVDSPQRIRFSSGRFEGAAPPVKGSAAYLREILHSEEAVRAAFEPVLRAARCSSASPYTDAVDRSAFACAVDRIVGYFNPSEPIGIRGPNVGPPYTVDEALAHFRMALTQLVTRLEELERPASAFRRGPALSTDSMHMLPAATGSMTTLASGRDAPLFAEDMQPRAKDWAHLPRPQDPPWRSWQPTADKLPSSVGKLPFAAAPPGRLAVSPPGRLTSWSPGPGAAVNSPPAGIGTGPRAPCLFAYSSPDVRIRANTSPAGTKGPADTPTTAKPWASFTSGAPPATGGNDPLEALEASRARVAGLRRALGREEDLLRQQAEETRRLEHLQRDLEVEAEAAARRKSMASAACAVPAGDGGRLDHEREAPSLCSLNEAAAGFLAGDEDAEADDALGGPMSLEDVKYHLRTVSRLRRRVVELEGALDGREEQVAVLSDELQRRTAALVARTAAA